MGKRLAAGKRAKNIACQYCLQRPTYVSKPESPALSAVELSSQPVALKSCLRIAQPVPAILE